MLLRDPFVEFGTFQNEGAPAASPRGAPASSSFSRARSTRAPGKGLPRGGDLGYGPPAPGEAAPIPELLAQLSRRVATRAGLSALGPSPKR